MLMFWILGHWTLGAIVVGFYLLVAAAAYRMALHATSYVHSQPIRVRVARKGLS